MRDVEDRDGRRECYGYDLIEDLKLGLDII